MNASPVGYNKLTDIEDFSDPDLLETLTDIFRYVPDFFAPDGSLDYIHRKWWEIAMSVRALRRFGALRPDALILGVGAGTELTSFYLTNHVRQVFATDLYLNPGDWKREAPFMMLVEPALFSPFSFKAERLVVQHMDGRLLRYPDESFDGIYSSGSIEHFGSFDFVANAAYEMGRVLKPGGVLTLSTEFKLAGPPEGEGWGPGTLLLSAEQIQHNIVEASGLEPVDEMRFTASDRTMATRRDLLESITTGTSRHVSPHLILAHEGYVFCSIHLTLRKTERYPSVDNRWAKPSPVTQQAVAELNQAIQTGAAKAPAAEAGTPRPGAEKATLAFDALRQSTEALRQWEVSYARARDSHFAQRLPTPLGFLFRTYLRLRYLGKTWDAQDTLYHGLVDANQKTAEALVQLEEQLIMALKKVD